MFFVLQVSEAVLNQRTQCSVILNSVSHCRVSNEATRSQLTLLRDELTRKRKAIAVELDNMFR